jgi:drug/metabolite transporter (DMT)-like permease
MSTYLAPLWAALFGWLFVNESLQDYHLVGAAMVLPGIRLARTAPPVKEEPPIP